MGPKIVERSPFALVFADGAHTLRVQIACDLVPAARTVHGWQVTDIQQEIEHLCEKGVALLRSDQFDQDAADVWTMPDGHKVAWFKDPSDNILSLTPYL